MSDSSFLLFHSRTPNPLTSLASSPLRPGRPCYFLRCPEGAILSESCYTANRTAEVPCAIS
jgi:hypothetical protein